MRRILVRTVLVLAIILSLFPAWWYSAQLRGRIVAHFDIARGHYRVLVYGRVNPQFWFRDYHLLLADYYGIEERQVAYDLVTDEIVSYVRAYNSVSMAAANRKFGHAVFEECNEEAIREWKIRKEW